MKAEKHARESDKRPERGPEKGQAVFLEVVEPSRCPVRHGDRSVPNVPVVQIIPKPVSNVPVVQNVQAVTD
jgi:hypothetical protein